MFVEDSGSSLDGEIGFMDSAVHTLQESFTSFDNGSPDIASAPPLGRESVNVIRAEPASPQVNDTVLSEDSLRIQERPQRHIQADIAALGRLNDSSSGNICDIFLPSCIKINTMLAERGMLPLSLSSTDIDADKRTMSVFVLDAWAESVVTSLEEVFQMGDRHRLAVQDTSFSSHTAEASREAMEKHIRDLQIKLETAERKLSVRSLETDNLEDSFEKTEKKLKSSEKEYQKKIKNLESIVKEGERKLKVANIENERMRKKLQQLVTKEREARDRYSDVLSGSAVVSLINGVSSSPNSKSRLKKVGRNTPPSPEDVVRALDADRLELEQCNIELRDQVQELTETIRDLENNRRFGEDTSAQRYDSDNYREQYKGDGVDEIEDCGNGRQEHDREYRSSPGSMKVMFAKIKEQQHRIEQLVHREGVLEAEKRRCDEALDVYRHRSSEMMEEIENLRIEIDGRPTVRAYAQKQKEVTELESKLHDVIMMRKEAAEVASFKKYLSTSDRIKADKRNHELGLWIIESIPTAVVKDVLQAACRELDISDISELQSSIVKLKTVVQTVPRIEAFVTKLCSFVFERQRPKYPEGDVKDHPVLEDIFPIIKKWWSQLTRGSELYKFQEAVLKELDRRERILGASSLNDNNDSETMGERPMMPELFSDHDIDEVANAFEWETRRRALWMKRDPQVAIDLISDLVNFQLESFQNAQSYRAASDFIAQNPEKMVSRLLSHLQYVFDVKDLQGLVPRMNQVYLSLEESRNFMSSLREYLNMKDAQSAAIITETLRRISGQNQTQLHNHSEGASNGGDTKTTSNRPRKNF